MQGRSGGVEAEVELVFPAEFKAGEADGVVAILRIGDSFRQVGGVRGDFMRNHSFADVVFVDLAGNVIEGERRPTGELPMYLKFFNERPDVTSVIHCHPPYVCAMAISAGRNHLMRPLYPETTTRRTPFSFAARSTFNEPVTFISWARSGSATEAGTEARAAI